MERQGADSILQTQMMVVMRVVMISELLLWGGEEEEGEAIKWDGAGDGNKSKARRNQLTKSARI